jgi:hypothetical protein
MSERKFRIRYADVVATLALILASGGTAYAATALPKKSVGTPQLKPEAVTAAKVHDGAITGRKLKPNAVTSDHVADGGISRADLAAARSVPASSLTGRSPASRSVPVRSRGDICSQGRSGPPRWRTSH